ARWIYKRGERMIILIGLLFGLSIYFLMYQFGFVSSEKAHLPSEIMANNLDSTLSRQATGEFQNKTWMSISRRFRPVEQRIKASNLRRRLVKAGSPMGVLEFLFLKLLSLIAVPMIAFILVGNKFPQHLVLIISLGIGYILPEVWLKRIIKIRQHKIRKDLPNIIDLLNLCVSGGMDFMLAVSRVVKELKVCDLTQELNEVYRQTQMGKSRREALKEFAWRIDMPEIYSFVRTLVQADRMGSPMAEALRLQSEEIRTRRFHRGEAMALKAPIKLLFPLFAFILPVVLVIVSGPILLNFVRNKISMGF
ncbi:MAG: type II secretion system F family protein, partial [Candidatus Omnitrophica bacterium]|nr:type II secretion system F family protein [Candidatus Omnitrophota bacterium]